ncbi:hypothetical protein N0B51_07425 [Tsuneonella sp. YG55]|uniref:Uncharacterized protein n=1 Tax=Tsuneonella litorea TaxID=2976475 RepID=A0A9X2W1C6_9SPHN|nr:hypothetical protein [Tsuneonella litorea]MCT2558808.1 hypothetical protein [Tsuneonella litorea]
MLESVGLGGDGDEAIAIENAFARFGVDVPIEDAPKWVTVGDVWSSLCRIVPRAPDQPDAFLRFCTALACESSVDPRLVDQDSRLLV